MDTNKGITIKLVILKEGEEHHIPSDWRVLAMRWSEDGRSVSMILSKEEGAEAPVSVPDWAKGWAN